MARKPQNTSADVLVLGAHAAAYVAATLLAKAGLRVVHAATHAEATVADRLTLVNPALFGLADALSPLKRKLTMTPLYGLRFLPPAEPSPMTFTSRAAVAMSVSVQHLRDALSKIAERDGVASSTVKTVEAVSANEAGVSVLLDGKPVTVRMLVLADELPTNARTVLHVNASFEAEVSHRYTWVTCKATQHLQATPKAGLVMSMDLAGKMLPAWLIPGRECFQLAVAQPIDSEKTVDPLVLLRQWAERLTTDGALLPGLSFKPSQVHSLVRPFAGALSGEGVANRTLLIGPAGGFISSTGEDVYPGCWSAVMAVDVVRKALKETHLQDALNPFRTTWRTTLGEYLRGPQQNLRHLLPLVYRNEVMTNRLAEAILDGKMMVR